MYGEPRGLETPMEERDPDFLFSKNQCILEKKILTFRVYLAMQLFLWKRSLVITIAATEAAAVVPSYRPLYHLCLPEFNLPFFPL